MGATVIGLESYAVTDFMSSREMAEMLDKKIGLRNRFSGPTLDFWSRLDRNAPAEIFASYWQTKIDPFFDLTTGAINVEVRAFSAQDSLDIANAAIDAASKRISDMRDKAREDELRGAKSDVLEAERRVVQTRKDLREIRDREHIYDPAQRVTAVQTTADRLRDDIAGMEVESRSLGASMAPGSPTMLVLQNVLFL